jgi:hypothetical protein
MSGGCWGYQSYRLKEAADQLEAKWAPLLRAVAESEHIVDWAEAGDATRRREDGSGAERDLYDLWLKTFNEVFGE